MSRNRLLGVRPGYFFRKTELKFWIGLQLIHELSSKVEPNWKQILGNRQPWHLCICDDVINETEETRSLDPLKKLKKENLIKVAAH